MSESAIHVAAVKVDVTALGVTSSPSWPATALARLVHAVVSQIRVAMPALLAGDRPIDVLLPANGRPALVMRDVGGSSIASVRRAIGHESTRVYGAARDGSLRPEAVNVAVTASGRHGLPFSVEPVPVGAALSIELGLPIRRLVSSYDDLGTALLAFRTIATLSATSDGAASTAEVAELLASVSRAIQRPETLPTRYFEPLSSKQRPLPTERFTQ